MKTYKNYFIAAGLLILGILLGNIFSGGASDSKEQDKNQTQEAQTTIWTCSMHPQIRMEKPGKCPICGMDLIPLETSGDATDTIASNEIVMTPEAIQLANIQTTVVEMSNASKAIRLLGKVKPDERRLYSQVSHIPGRIERLYVNFTGEKVVQGQPIVRLYSPDLISAQKELFEAIRSRDVYPQLYTASRNKLKLWKLSDKQIDAIEKSGKVNEQVDIYSDYSGYVMKRNVELGDHVMAGDNLFDIANLNTVWVMFEAYESDIPWIHIGDAVDFTIQAIPGKDFEGKVTYVDPFVSSSTRVAKVRVEVNNADKKLLPEMYATGIIKSTLSTTKKSLIIPKSAVLWTGKRAVVYVKVPHKNTISFVYREIILGQDMGDFYLVESGLKPGEEVATNGVFRIDASAQLLGQKSMMNPTGSESSTNNMTSMPGMDMESGPDTTKSQDEDMGNMVMIDQSKIDAKFKSQLGAAVATYIKLKNALTDDNAIRAQEAANKVKEALAKVDMYLLLGDAHNAWMKVLNPMEKAVNRIANTTEIGVQRDAFLVLGDKLSNAVKTFGVKTENNQPLYLDFCPMANKNNGGYWLSYDKEIKNPFFGKAMPTCGEIKATY